jgi:hypothetical protein
MKFRILLPFFLFCFACSTYAQDGLRVVDILNEGHLEAEKEKLVIKQDPRIDTLVNRHILSNTKKSGVDGWRIQIYRGGHRTAQEEANKIKASFIDNFPELSSDVTFDKPNWFKVKVGDFRSREEAAAVFYKILAKYPDAYLIRDVITIKNSGR